jgi:hypothetical protein
VPRLDLAARGADMKTKTEEAMRVLGGLAVALALSTILASCGPGEKTTASTSAAPAASVAPLAETAEGSPFPQWLQVANQAGGGAVYYHPASINRTADVSTSDIWVQVVYGEDQTYVIEDKTTRQTITYNRERILFKFDCNKITYAILERRLMGAGEEVAETFKTPIKSERDWRPVNDGGVTAVTYGPACQAVIKAP